MRARTIASIIGAAVAGYLLAASYVITAITTALEGAL